MARSMGATGKRRLPHERVAEGHSTNPQQKETDQVVRDSEEHFRVLFELAPDGYYLCDSEGRFLDGNRMAEELVGYSREELLGKSFLELDLLSVDQPPQAAALLTENVEGHPTGPNEFVLKRKDGGQVVAE